MASLRGTVALHGLAPVTYSDADDAQVAQSSLMMAANGALDHTPPNIWKCWTQVGYNGSSSSNLYGGTISPFLVWSTEDDFIAGWMTEPWVPSAEGRLRIEAKASIGSMRRRPQFPAHG